MIFSVSGTLKEAIEIYFDAHPDRKFLVDLLNEEDALWVYETLLALYSDKNLLEKIDFDEKNRNSRVFSLILALQETNHEPRDICYNLILVYEKILKTNSKNRKLIINKIIAPPAYRSQKEDLKATNEHRHYFSTLAPFKSSSIPTTINTFQSERELIEEFQIDFRGQLNRDTRVPLIQLLSTKSNVKYTSQEISDCKHHQDPMIELLKKKNLNSRSSIQEFRDLLMSNQFENEYACLTYLSEWIDLWFQRNVEKKESS